MSFSFGSTYMIELQRCFKVDSKYLVISLDHPDSHMSINSLIGSLTGIDWYLKDKKNTEVAKGVDDFIINNKIKNKDQEVEDPVESKVKE
jgi:hypothetical protein